MRYLTCKSVFLIVIAWSLRASGGDILTRELLKSLPAASKQGLVPVLEVEWSKPPVDQFALLVELRTSRWHSLLFNPFGDSAIGCPYQIVVTDLDWNIVYHVMRLHPANNVIPHPNAWIDADNKRVIGRRFWRQCDWKLTSNQMESPPDPVNLVEGKYLLHLLVTERLETYPPFNEGPVGDERAQALWRTEELDRFVCRSQPVPIQVGADGKVQRPTSETPDPQSESAIRLTTTISKQGIMSQAILITDKEHEATNPGLRGSTFDVGFHVKPPVEDARFYLNHTFAGKEFGPSPEDFRHIPQDAILGVRRLYYGPLDPGAYEISFTLPSRIWLDQKTVPADLTTSVQVDVTPEQLAD